MDSQKDYSSETPLSTKPIMSRTPDQYPQLLAIMPSDFRHSDAGAAILARQLLAGWPRERLASISARHRSDVGASDRRDRYERHHCTIAGGSEASHFPRLKRLTRFVLGKQASADPLFLGRPSREMISWLDAFAPDVIYAQPSTPMMMTLTSRLARELGIPIVNHIMDDHYPTWPTWHPSSYILNRLVRQPASAYYKTVFRRSIHAAAANCTISAAMADEYARRFNRPFVPIPPSIARSDAAQLQRSVSSSRLRTPNSLIFAGTILRHTNAATLEVVGDTLIRLRDTSPSAAWTLDVYCTHLDREAEHLRSHPGLRFRPPLAQENLWSRYSEYCAALLPFNVDRVSLNYMALSFPSKLPELFAAGLPLLYVGPQSAGFFPAIRDSGTATTAYPAVDSISTALHELATLSQHDRLGRSNTGWAAYESGYQLEEVQARLLEILFDPLGDRQGAKPS